MLQVQYNEVIKEFPKVLVQEVTRRVPKFTPVEMVKKVLVRQVQVVGKVVMPAW